mgnify:FL=1
MNLKKQIAVIVLALTATTSPVWSQDKQALQSPTAHTLQGRGALPEPRSTV